MPILTNLIKRLCAASAIIFVGLLLSIASALADATPSNHTPPSSSVSRQPLADIKFVELPPEAQSTLALIKKGGPFPYSRDGVTFQNREKLLPLRARGYYREYTVSTPGAKNRGARRIVAGRSSEYYYTNDHYRSFRVIKE